jgi:hypothetical protein
MKKVIKKTLEYLENGKIKKAIRYFLSKRDKTEPIHESVILLSSRLEYVKECYEAGLVTKELYKVTINQIKQSFLYILKEEREDVSQPKISFNDTQKKNKGKISLEEFKTKLYNLIANNKLEDGISLFMEQLDKDDKILLELIALLARYQNMKRQIMIGCLSFSDEQEEANKISSNLLVLLDKKIK